jgi:hypothetical protein
MAKIVSRVVKGRAKFDFNTYDKAQSLLWDQIAAAPKKVPGDTDTEAFTRKIDALAMHLAGMPIADAARNMHMTPAALYNFKSRWMQRDSSLAPILANLLESSAVKSLIVFNAKADDMDAGEAASAAATLSKAAVNLRTGQNTNYTPPENVALETLDRISRVLELAPKVMEPKRLKGRVVNVEDSD